MESTNFTIKGGSGRYTYLDKIYTKFLEESLADIDVETQLRWKLYEQIMSELKSLGYLNVFEEVKYRLTGGEDPSLVMLDVIERDSELNTTFDTIKNKLNEYIREDKIKRFM